MSRDERRLHWSSGILSTALKGPTFQKQETVLRFLLAHHHHHNFIIIITILIFARIIYREANRHI